MARNPAASRLTEAHRQAQLRLGRQVIAQMLAAWPALDPMDLDGTFDRWLRVVVPLIQANRSTSSTLAANYLATFRALELGLDAGSLAPVLARPADIRRLTTSMLVTGPVSIRSNLGRRVSLERAATIAQANTSRSAMRHALGGGRETITRTVATDRRAQGWQRIASAKACNFCSMLADRGDVYGQGTVEFQAHDGCSCGAEPVYR